MLFLALNCSLELAQMSCDVIVYYLLRLYMYMWPPNATLTNDALLTRGVKHACDSFCLLCSNFISFLLTMTGRAYYPPPRRECTLYQVMLLYSRVILVHSC